MTLRAKIECPKCGCKITVQERSEKADVSRVREIFKTVDSLFDTVGNYMEEFEKLLKRKKNK